MDNSKSILLYSEIFAIEQRLRARLSNALPDDMELSHFSVLNQLVAMKNECTPLQLAKSLNVTKGAITNTLSRLEKRGYIHVREDWEDARRKHIGISRSGQLARDIAISETAHIFDELSALFDDEDYKNLIAQLRKIRLHMS